VCAVGGRNLRPPFPVFDDERHLTFTIAEVESKNIRLTEEAAKFVQKDPLPLSDEHHLRECPDCKTWFLASENPSNFRCPSCAELWRKNRGNSRYEEEEEVEESEQLEHAQTAVMMRSKSGFDTNVLVILAGAVALIGLLTWFVIKSM